MQKQNVSKANDKIIVGELLAAPENKKIAQSICLSSEGATIPMPSPMIRGKVALLNFRNQG